MIDKNAVILLYKNRYSLTQIATRFSVSKQRIHQIVKGYKNTGRAGRIPKYNALPKTCIVYGEIPIFLHHIDGNNKNDSIKNLLPVCQKHHFELHREGKGEGVRLHIYIPENLLIDIDRYCL